MNATISFISDLEKSIQYTDIHLRGDKIFWIGNDHFNPWTKTYEYRTKIFEILDISGQLHIKSIGYFEFSSMMHFPSIITTLPNWKSIIYPQNFWKNDRRESIFCIEIEKSEKTQGLNWSYFHIPINISDEAGSGFWIFKVQVFCNKIKNKKQRLIQTFCNTYPANLRIRKFLLSMCTRWHHTISF